MIAFLKNGVFRIWSAGLLAFVSSLGLLTQTGAAFALDAALPVFGVLFGATFVGLGWLSDRIVRIQLGPLLQEAEILERGGMGTEAERTFDKALNLLDSLLISPRRRRHYLRVLAEKMARFYTARAEKSSRAYLWIERYLQANPADGTIAAAWLQDMERRAQWTPDRQELAARIGEACRDDRQTQQTLAAIFIRAGRTDFPALQTYQRVLIMPDGSDGALATEMAELFIKEGRADELALQAYVRAAGQSAPAPDLRCGLAACLRWTHETERNHAHLSQARRIIGPADADALERMSSGFIPPSGDFEPTIGAGRPGVRLRSGIDRVFGRGRTIGRQLAQGALSVAAGVKTPYGRKLAQMTVIGGLVISSAALIFSTAGHLVKPPDPASNEVVKTAPAPYTLQVAAYLKSAHADRFIETLKTEGQDAYRIEVQRQRKTWYQVRLGRFHTKEAARSHGHQLKTEGIIDDFYVANYQRLQFDNR